MNKCYKIILTFILLLFSKNTYAECTYTDKANLNKLAANVKIDYEINTKTIDPNSEEYNGEEEGITLTYDYIDLIFTNISNELYVTGTESTSSEEITVFPTDLVDGKKTISYFDTSFIRKYTFKIIASDESNCGGETLKTLYVTLPMRNIYADYCGEEETDFYMCKPFVTTSIDSYSTFSKKYDAYHNKDTKEDNTTKEDKWYDIVLNKIDNYKYYILGVISIVIVIIIIVRIIKTKKQRELGL